MVFKTNEQSACSSTFIKNIYQEQKSKGEERTLVMMKTKNNMNAPVQAFHKLFISLVNSSLYFLHSSIQGNCDKI